eukprot:14614281-Alexandrium_andersonii.AAC.1
MESLGVGRRPKDYAASHSGIDDHPRIRGQRPDMHIRRAHRRAVGRRRPCDGPRHLRRGVAAAGPGGDFGQRAVLDR